MSAVKAVKVTATVATVTLDGEVVAKVATVTDVAAEIKYLGSRFGALSKREAKIAQDAGALMPRASHAVWEATRLGVLDWTPAKAHSFAAADNRMSQKDFAAAISRSSSTVTLYRRVGKCWSLGIKPKTDAWNVLANLSKANDKAVGEAIDDPKATKASIEARLWSVFGKDGKRLPKATDEGRPEGNAKIAGEDAEGNEVSVPATLDNTLAHLERLLMALPFGSGSNESEAYSDALAKVEALVLAMPAKRAAKRAEAQSNSGGRA